MQDDALIARCLEHNRHYPGLDAARIREYSVSVWSIIAHLCTVGGDVAHVAAHYALPCEAVEAAIVYYRRYKDLIDARIAANAA